MRKSSTSLIKGSGFDLKVFSSSGDSPPQNKENSEENGENKIILTTGDRATEKPKRKAPMPTEIGSTKDDWIDSNSSDEDRLSTNFFIQDKNSVGIIAKENVEIEQNKEEKNEGDQEEDDEEEDEEENDKKNNGETKNGEESSNPNEKTKQSEFDNSSELIQTKEDKFAKPKTKFKYSITPNEELDLPRNSRFDKINMNGNMKVVKKDLLANHDVGDFSEVEIHSMLVRISKKLEKEPYFENYLPIKQKTYYQLSAQGVILCVLLDKLIPNSIFHSHRAIVWHPQREEEQVKKKLFYIFLFFF